MEKKFYQEYKITEWKFWQNFWDYYKVHMLFGAMIIFLIIIGVRSCAMRVDYDFSLTYFGEEPMLTPAKFEMLLQEWTEDMDGDGQIMIDISNNPFGEGETAEDTTALLNRIDADLIAADPFILMTDGAYVDRFVNMRALQPLDEIVSGIEIPEEYVKRDAVTNEIVAIDITEYPIGDIVGITSGTKMYIGMKVLPDSKLGNVEYIKRHEQVAGIIRKMMEYK